MHLCTATSIDQKAYGDKSDDTAFSSEHVITPPPHTHIHTSQTQGISECYECQPKPAAKTFPGCTIRNTPSEPIHCIVWAKHLFSQLFGEPDADNDVSPETEEGEEGKGEEERMDGKWYQMRHTCLHV